jgi:hypothetical protein
MAIAKAHVLYAWASAKDRVEMVDGGYELTNPLVVGRNPNIATYRYYDTIPIAQTSEFATAKFSWTRVAASVMISDQEQDENAGSTKVFDLLAKKMDVLEESVQDQFSTWLYGTGTGNDPNGLGLLLPSDPTTGTVGNISRATNTYWRPSSYDFAGTLNAGNIEMAWDDIFLDLTVKNEKPDIIICGRNIWRMYKQAVRDKWVIMVFDEDCDVNTAFFINSKYIRLHILKGVNWKLKQLNAPWTQDVTGRRMVWQGNWAIWKAWRTHGRVAA